MDPGPELEAGDPSSVTETLEGAALRGGPGNSLKPGWEHLESLQLLQLCHLGCSQPNAEEVHRAEHLHQ